MGDPVERDAEEAAERVYDAFLEAALAGETHDPEVFLARSPDLPVSVQDALLGRMRSIHGLIQSTSTEHGPRAEAIGQLGDFRLLERLDGGAMGDVFLAEQVSLGRRVALKTMRAEIASSPAAATRFEREARALARLHHGNVVAVHGFGEQDGVRYLAMEFVEGRSLKEILRQAAEQGERLAPARVARWGAQLARGLAAVHAAGLLHRDVKPSNVRIDAEDRAVLVDFGLARLPGSSDVSRTGEFVGSPAYASPEQVRGESELDGRSDVYSLGATLYHALAGVPPFEGEHVEAVLHANLQRDPQPLRTHGEHLPRDLELVCAKAMEKAPERRYADARGLAEDLEAVLALRPVRARPASTLGRAHKWVRRNRGTAVSLAVAVSAVLLSGLFLLYDWAGERRERRSEAAAALEQARRSVDRYRTDREEVRNLERELDRLRIGLEYEHLDDFELDLLGEIEGQVEAARLRRERTFYEVGDHLGQALRIAPELVGAADETRARLLVERVREALDARDPDAVSFYTAELTRHDPSGEVRAAEFPYGELTVRASRPGMRAWLFRCDLLSELVEGGERRRVFVPYTGEAPFEPPVPFGSLALRVTRAAGDWRVGDLLIGYSGRPLARAPIVDRIDAPDRVPGLAVGDVLADVDGYRPRDLIDLRHDLEQEPGEGHRYRFEGAADSLELRACDLVSGGVAFADDAERASRPGTRVVRHTRGTVEEAFVVQGLGLRPTMTPLFLDPACEVAVGAPLRLEPERYLLVADAPGHDLLRLPFRLDPGEVIEAVPQLHATGTAPAGFVQVSRVDAGSGSYWMCEHELTAGEYLEFLNDPATLAEIDASHTLIRAPRPAATASEGGVWVRGSDGTYTLPEGTPATWPVVGISFEDAQAYAAWRTARDGYGRYRLPTADEAALAAVYDSRFRFSWGHHFHQRFANTCYSRRTFGPEPVCSNPVDESAFGVFDTCGNALEWVDSWWDLSRHLKHAIGGAWGQARIQMLNAYGGRGFRDGDLSGETGMRLAWEHSEH